MPISSTRSAKNKGRRLQKIIVDLILNKIPTLTSRDVTSTPMGVNGADVTLSEAAASLFPYEIEAKNQEIFGTIYKFYDQAKSHGDLEPLLVIKMNKRKPLAIVDLEHFLNLRTKNE